MSAVSAVPTNCADRAFKSSAWELGLFSGATDVTVLHASVHFVIAIFLSCLCLCCALHFAEAGKLAAADLHKATSNSFSLYKKRPIKVRWLCDFFTM